MIENASLQTFLRDISLLDLAPRTPQNQLENAALYPQNNFSTSYKNPLFTLENPFGLCKSESICWFRVMYVCVCVLFVCLDELNSLRSFGFLTLFLRLFCYLLGGWTRLLLSRREICQRHPPSVIHTRASAPCRWGRRQRRRGAPFGVRSVSWPRKPRTRSTSGTLRISGLKQKVPI